MLIAVLSGFILAILAPTVDKLCGRRTGWIMGLLPLGLFLYFARLIPQVRAGEKIVQHHPWLPELGMNLSFLLDGLSLLFSLMITGIGALVFIYSGGYLGNHRDSGKFYSSLLVFMASMLGLVLADNLIGLFVFWELTSVSSYLLIGFDHEREPARRSALQALLVTGLGGLTLLAAFLLMHWITGTFEASAMVDKSSQLTASPLYPVIFVLCLIGTATKSAQVPFHFWLPNAMEAPTPVSTYLHSATMVKAGVYLLARLTPVLGGTELWQGSLMALGTTTMVTGAWLAVFQTDLKRILAYTTVSSLGLFVSLIGVGTALAFEGCMVSLLAHSIYKGGLFLVAGIIDHGTGTRNAQELGRLCRAMPITSAAALLLFLSNAGAPPFLGFLGKEILLDTSIQGPFPRLLVPAAVWASLASIAMAGIVGLRPFWRSDSHLREEPHEACFDMWMGPMTLGILGLLLGWTPHAMHALIIVPAVSACLGQAVSIAVPQWHGFDLKVLLSVLAFVLGGMLLWKWDTVKALSDGVTLPRKVGPGALYDRSLRLLECFARVQTRFFQSGSLNRYLLMIVGTSTALLVWALARDGLGMSALNLERWTNTRLYEIIIAMVLLGATAVVVRASSRLVAIVALGGVGYGVALIFLLFSAPDLAMTQFAVETLSVILLVLVLLKLPRYQTFSTRPQRFRDAVVSLSGGAVITLLVLAVTALDRKSTLVEYFAENSLILAKGRNVVNVILVDFRGFDTLGEITVLGAAAVGVYALIKLRPGGAGQASGSTSDPS